MTQHDAIAPVCKPLPKELVAHGDVRIDNYYWLNDRDDPAVISYLEEENAFTQSVLEPTKDLQADLVKEFRARMQETDTTVPVKDGPFEYFTRTVEGKAYPIHCRRRAGRPDGKVEVLFDVNAMSEGHGYYSLGSRATSPDHRSIAYAIDTTGRRIYDIEIRNLERGDIERGIKGTSGNVVWAEDGKTLFYARRDPKTLRSFQIWAHTYETSPGMDRLVFEEADPEYSCYVTKTRSKRFITIVSSQTLSTEVRVIDAMTPNAAPRIVLPRERAHEYSVDHAGDQFFILTNKNAENFRLVTAPVENPGQWTQMLPHRLDTLLEDIDVFDGHLVARERRGGLIHLVVHPLGTASDLEPFEIDFDDPTYRAGLSGNLEFETAKIRYSYSSLTTPPSTLEYDLATGETERLKEQHVGGGFNRDDYVSKRVFAEAPDGASIPISIVMRRDRAESPGPLLLYGYGSYGSTIDASFNSNVVSLLDRGFAYAIAHVRGGQALGRAWYEHGKLKHKKNTFTDFIASAEALVADGTTSSDQLFAMGGSAGGLLIGAVANMRPDLFEGLVAAVPFVDVVTTMLDDTIPLTTFEYDEWGNPNVKADYDYMLSYSPYDQVAAQAYPHMLVTTGLHDSQVQYFEPAKWVAKLRALKSDQNLLLFDCEMKAGHGGVSGRYGRLDKTAQTYAFMLSLLDG